ncbi:hypothetical protein [Brevibacterium aurantiacum]|uniref:hypothetical protein n=1 Tax=Brevibacterium aurantiacum TaxID=273384 RepID=UPI001642614A|nr:hypothetical protein [Brevibacterium aurantiacum]
MAPTTGNENAALAAIPRDESVGDDRLRRVVAGRRKFGDETDLSAVADSTV